MMRGLMIGVLTVAASLLAFSVAAARTAEREVKNWAASGRD